MEAIFAGGCFWGLEYFFKELPGINSTTVGYTGGHKENPTYEEVCSGTTGHLEALRIEYDPSTVSYESLVRRFFEIHDPTQAGRQGPDIGEQYSSALFYLDKDQERIAKRLIDSLKAKGFDVVTMLLPAKKFYPAEEYHQDYYGKKGGVPYCHVYVKRF